MLSLYISFHQKPLDFFFIQTLKCLYFTWCNRLQGCQSVGCLCVFSSLCSSIRCYQCVLLLVTDLTTAVITGLLGHVLVFVVSWCGNVFFPQLKVIQYFR